MRNVIAVVIAGAVGAYTTWLTLHGIVYWNLWVGSLVSSVRTVTVGFVLLMHTSEVLTGFIGCLPAGVVAGLVAAPRWRRSCGALAGALTWSIMLFIARQFLLDNPEVVRLIIPAELVQLCASVGGGLVGAIIYQKLDSKWRREPAR